MSILKHFETLELGSDFFVVKGALTSDAPSYVVRQADESLYSALMQGKFCYVLTSRQLGKSSLMARSAQRLREAGVAVATVDLTTSGKSHTVEQWYNDFLEEVGCQLGLGEQLVDFVKPLSNLSPLRRWIRAIHHFLSLDPERRVTIFIDEVDYILRQPIDAGEFFAGIRSLYNARTDDPDLNRLSFCLLGVATPSDLIKDPKATPFNIGQPVRLTDFSEKESRPLLKGLRKPEIVGERILRRVHYWTGGHPYLMQLLCSEAAKDVAVQSARDIDRLCKSLFFSTRSREQDPNLTFVRDEILQARGENEPDLVSVLQLYRRVCRSEKIKDDDTNPVINALQLSGIVRTVNGFLCVRNEIYSRVFDTAWVDSSMPGIEKRRLQAEYRRGVRRTAIFASLIVIVLSVLILVAVNQASRAREMSHRAQQMARVADNSAREAKQMGSLAERRADERKQALVRLYVSNGLQLVDRGDYLDSLPWLVQALDFEKADPVQQTLHRTRLRSVLQRSPQLQNMWFQESEILDVRFVPNTNRLVSISKTGGRIWNSDTGEVASSFLGPVGQSVELVQPSFAAEGLKLAVAGNSLVDSVHEVQLWDTGSDRSLGPALSSTSHISKVILSGDGDSALMIGYGTPSLCNFKDGKWVEYQLSDFKGDLRDADFSPDGRTLVTVVNGSKIEEQDLLFYRSRDARRIGGRLHYSKNIDRFAFSSDGKRIAIVSQDDEVRVWDVESGKALTPVFSPFNPVLNLWFTEDNKQLVVAGGIWNDSDTGSFPHVNFLGARWSVQVWNPDNGIPVTEIMTYGTESIEGWFSSDRSLLATADDHGSVEVWDWRQRKHLAGPLLGSGQVKNVTFGFDDARMAVLDGSNGVRVWDIRNGNPITPTLRHESTVTVVGFSPEGRKLVTGTAQGIVRLWDLVSNEVETAESSKGLDVKRLWSNPDGGVVVIGDAAIRVWGESGYGASSKITVGASPVSFALAKGLVAVGMPDSARVWSPDARTAISPLLPHSGKVVALAFKDGGHYLSTATDGGKVQVWDVISGSVVGTPLDLPVQSETYFDSGGNVLVTGGSDGSAYAVDLRDRTTIKMLSPYPRPRFPVYSPFSKEPTHESKVAVSDDGHWAAVARDAEVRVWDLSKRISHNSFQAIHGIVDSISFAPDGRRLLFVAGHRSARVWDTENGGSLTPHLVHEGVFSACYSRDGKRILTVAPHSLQVWDASTSTPITIPIPSKDEITSAFLVRNGTEILALVGSAIRTWSLAPDSRSIQELTAESSILGLNRIDETGALIPLDSKALRAAWNSRALAHPRSEPPLDKWEESEAATCEASGNWHCASFYLGLLLDNSPRSVQLTLRLAVVREKAQQYAEALTNYSRVTRIDDKNVDGWRGFARVSFRLRQWTDALAGWTRATNLSPEDAASWIGRGDASAELAQLDQASLDFVTARQNAGATKQSVRPEQPWQYRYALARLGVGDIAAYKTTCQQMISAPDLESIYTTEIGNAVNEVLWTCSLAPDALSDFNHAIQLGEELLKQYPRCGQCFNTVGVLLYRAGKYQLAIDKLQQSLALQGNNGTLLDHIFLALARYRLGEATEARLWEQRVNTEIASAGMQSDGNGGQALNWQARTELRLFFNEMKLALAKEHEHQ